MKPIEEQTLFDLIEGLAPVDPKELEDYEREMVEAVPQIIQAVKERRRLAEEARIREILRSAAENVRPLREKELAGERITSEVMNLILY